LSEEEQRELLTSLDESSSFDEDLTGAKVCSAPEVLSFFFEYDQEKVN